MLFFAQLEYIQCPKNFTKKMRAFWINWMESFFWHSIKQKQGTNICNTCPKPLYYIQLKKYHNSSLSKFLIYCYIWMNDVSVSRLNTVMILWSNESMTMSFNQNIIYLLSSISQFDELASCTSNDFQKFKLNLKIVLLLDKICNSSQAQISC